MELFERHVKHLVVKKSEVDPKSSKAPVRKGVGGVTGPLAPALPQESQKAAGTRSSHEEHEEHEESSHGEQRCQRMSKISEPFRFSLETSGRPDSSRG